MNKGAKKDEGKDLALPKRFFVDRQLSTSSFDGRPFDVVAGKEECTRET